MVCKRRGREGRWLLCDEIGGRGYCVMKEKEEGYCVVKEEEEDYSAMKEKEEGNV